MNGTKRHGIVQTYYIPEFLSNIKPKISRDLCIYNWFDLIPAICITIVTSVYEKFSLNVFYAVSK